MVERKSTKNEMSEAIISVASEEFYSKGIRAVKMDDIAHSLGISKRTLYEHFPDKERLLLAVCQKGNNDFLDAIAVFKEENAPNIMEMILYSFQLKMRSFERIAPLFFEELKRYPHVTEYFDSFAEERASQFVEVCMLGVEQGLFRDDVNYKIVQQMFDADVDLMFNSANLHHYPQTELFFNICIVNLRGFSTLKGIQLLDDFILKNYK